MISTTGTFTPTFPEIPGDSPNLPSQVSAAETAVATFPEIPGNSGVCPGDAPADVHKGRLTWLRRPSAWGALALPVAIIAALAGFLPAGETLTLAGIALGGLILTDPAFWGDIR